MLVLRNPVQRYDWGSPDRLARFLGRAPDGGPQAELWIGAHPSAPSTVRVADADLEPRSLEHAARDRDGHLDGDSDQEDGRDQDSSRDREDGSDRRGDGRWIGLDRLIAEDPQRWVGAEVLERFGPVLPFLFKVLAAAEPLSLQLHPDQVAAQRGFAAEEAAGVPQSDPARRYRDPNHKPELLVALDGFEVLSGLRPASETAAVFSAFDLPQPWVELARGLEPGELCARLWQLDRLEAAGLVELVVQAAGSARGDPAPAGPVDDRAAVAVAVGGVGDGGAQPERAGAAARFPAECDFVRRAAACHPGDIGVVVGLCLNRASLEPDEGAFAEPGVLHSYLGGFGLEIMANSDNVLRGGLTTKTVDVAELRRHLVGHSTTPRRVAARPHQLRGGVEWRFDVLVDEFALSSLHPDPDDGAAMAVRSDGPEVLLCVEGEVSVSFVPPDTSETSDTSDTSDGADLQRPPQPVREADPGSSGTPAASSKRMVLRRGRSVFVPAGQGEYLVSGVGRLYRAQVGIHARQLWAGPTLDEPGCGSPRVDPS